MKFVLRGKPLVFKRPIHTRWKVFDPLSSQKNDAKLILIKQYPKIIYDSQALHMDIVFYMPKPKTGKNKNALYHTIRPDIDNMLKPLLDVCTGVIWKDDCLVSSISAKKVYDSIPRTVIELSTLKDSNG